MDEFTFLTPKLEFKSFEGKYIFKGYLETFEEDRFKDICTKACLEDMANQINKGINGFRPTTKGDLEHKPTILKDPFLPAVSRLTAGKVDDVGLFVEGMFNPDHPHFETYWNETKNGFLDGLSMTYGVIERVNRANGGRILNKVDLTGYAHTGKPVQKSARLTEVFAKSLAANELLSETKNTFKEEGTMTEKPEEKKSEETPETPKEETKEETKETKEETKEEKVEVKSEPEKKEEKTEAKIEVKSETKVEATEKPFKLTEEIKSEMANIFKSEIKKLQPDKKTLVTTEEEIKSMSVTDLTMRLAYGK